MIEPINIGKALYDRLMAQQDAIVAVQQMMQMFQQNCEAKLSGHQRNTRAIWEDILKEHPGLDVENTVWVPGKEPGTIVAVQQRFPDAPAKG